jgi:phospholipase C
VVDASKFAADLKNGSLPDFSFYSPDVDDDGHDTDIATSDLWFERTFSPLLSDPHFKNVLLIATFDENECNTIGPRVSPATIASCKGDLNQVYTVLYGAGVKSGATTDASYNHYSLLRTIENGLGLATLGNQDETAAPITGIWE